VLALERGEKEIMPNSNNPEWHITKVMRERREEQLRQQNGEPGIAAERPPAQFLPYGRGKRMFYGLLWSFWTFAFAYGGFILLATGHVAAGMACLVLSIIAGKYTHRIWTWQAKHLWFFIIF
jgi:hypothetical protein